MKGQHGNKFRRGRKPPRYGRENNSGSAKCGGENVPRQRLRKRDQSYEGCRMSEQSNQEPSIEKNITS